MQLEPKKKSDVQFNGEKFDISSWSIPYTSTVNKEFQDRYDNIIKQYEELSEEIYWNNIIYALEIRYQPVIGNIYYLYKENEKYVLSMITPWEWKKEFIGKFKFDYNGKWNKIKE
jgi:hypothetical protein